MAKENSLDSWIDSRRMKQLLELVRPGSLQRPSAPPDTDINNAGGEAERDVPAMPVEKLLPDEIPQRAFVKGIRPKLPQPEPPHRAVGMGPQDTPLSTADTGSPAPQAEIGGREEKQPVSKESVPREKEPISKDSISKEPISKEPISKEPISKEPISKDSISKENPEAQPPAPEIPSPPPPEREVNPLTLYFHSTAATPEARAKAFVHWVRDTANASAAFVVDGYGTAIAAEPETDSVFLASLSNLADALGRARDHFSRPDQSALHLEMEEGRILCVLQAKWDVATVALGLIRETALPREMAIRYRQELARLAQKPRRRPRD